MKGIFRMRTKKVIACILAACTMLASISIQGVGLFSSADDTTADNGEMRDKLTAFQLAYDMGIGINLGNTFEGYWEDTNNPYSGAQTIGSNTPQEYEVCWMPNGSKIVTTQEIIDGMRDAGFKTVRIPVYWGNMMEKNDSFTISKEYLNRVKEVIDYCRNDDLYAVINIHHYDKFIITHYKEEEALRIMGILWTQIAEYYKDYSDYLVFEGYNEYVGAVKSGENNTVDEKYDYVNKLNQTFVDSVRKTGGNNATRLLIASGYNTNIDKTSNEKFVMPTDTAFSRLMISVHYLDNEKYWSNKVGNAEWMDYCQSQCKLLKDAFFDKGYPVFLGETTVSVNYTKGRFASDATTNTATDAMDYVVRLILGNGFVPVLWDQVDYGFYSRTEYKLQSQTDIDAINALLKQIDDGIFRRPEPPVKPIDDTTEPSSDPSSDPSSEPSSNPSSDPSSDPSSEPSSDNSSSSNQTNPPASAPTTAKPATKAPTTPIATTNAKAVKAAKDKANAEKIMKQAKITKLTAKAKGKKKIVVSWKKVKNAKGYEVQVATNKKFKKNKIIVTKNVKGKKVTIKSNKIKRKKIYYIRVRAYTTYQDANGITQKVYSSWIKKIRKVKAK